MYRLEKSRVSERKDADLTRTLFLRIEAKRPLGIGASPGTMLLENKTKVPGLFSRDGTSVPGNYCPRMPKV